MAGVTEPTDVLVIGAGIAGLSCARALVAAGHCVRVVDKGRGVGGRMATRRIGDARFDHGAQFFTARSPAFTETVNAAIADGAVTVWSNGFGDPPDGYPRFRGTEGMTSLVKWMCAGIDVELGTTIVDLADRPAAAYVLTAPVPQSLAILSFSRLLPEPPRAIGLAAVAYKPTIAVLATLASSPTIGANHGGHQFVDDPGLAFISDNQAKGVSPVPALTIHLSNDLSTQRWDTPDAEVLAEALRLAEPHIGPVTVVDYQVQRWRYAGPVEVWPEPTVVWGDQPIVALAGEAFDGPKVEGAFLSGLAAADAVISRLDRATPDA